MLLLCAALPAQARDEALPTVLERREAPIEQSGDVQTHRLDLTLAYFREGGWTEETILSALRQSAGILGQCGLALATVELVQIDAPDRYRYFETAISRELARALPLRRPAVYFVIDTRQRPAFDAEAIGRGNSRSRPELANTVWITRGARDPGVVLAHELAHVLMDSGEHSEEPGNLMREETAPANVRLSEAQCGRIRSIGTQNGLVLPAQGPRLRIR
jgi:hypothetical protein